MIIAHYNDGDIVTRHNELIQEAKGRYKTQARLASFAYRDACKAGLKPDPPPIDEATVDEIVPTNLQAILAGLMNCRNYTQGLNDKISKLKCKSC